MKKRHIATGMLALAVTIGMSAGTLNAGSTTWTGDGDGSTWSDNTNWNSGTPTAATDALIPGTDNPTITIASGVSATALNLTGKGGTVTIQLQDNSSLTGASGGLLGSDNGATLTLLGPTVDSADAGDDISATVTYDRLYMSHTDTPRNTVKLSGAKLTIDLTPGVWSGITGTAVVEIINGTTVKEDDSFYVRGTGGSRLSILNGTFSQGNVYIYDAGLTQLASDGTIDGPHVYVGLSSESGGRFEAEGTGLKSPLRAYGNGGSTVAVGLTDPNTGTRTSAATLTLNENATLQAGSQLEFGIFSAPGTAGVSNDLLNLNGNDLTSNGSLLEIVTYGYTPKFGQMYQLIAGNTGYAFDTSDIDALWTITRDSSGVYATRVPEPAGLGLLAVGGLLAMRRRR